VVKKKKRKILKKSAESINQTRKAKFDGPGLGGTTADFAKIEPAVGTKVIGRHDRFLGLKNENFV
jgi:hypothetical protein